MANDGRRGWPIVALLLWAVALGAQTSEPAVLRSRRMQIPIVIQELERPRLAEVQLHYSTDRGRTWRHYRSADPDRESFEFEAWEDGEYWFAVRSVDHSGERSPYRMDESIPSQRVIVDTLPPTISLRGLNPVGGRIGVEWSIDDPGADPATLRVEYRPKGIGAWRPAPAEPTAAGRSYWTPAGGGDFEIRARVLDRAGNVGVESIRISTPQGVPASRRVGPREPARYPVREDVRAEEDIYRPPPPMVDRDRPFAGMEPQRVREPERTAPRRESRPRGFEPPHSNPELVNSTRFALNYRFMQVGKSGIGSVSMYWTDDGRNWHYWGDDDDRESPFLIDVPGEGIYGFTLVATSGAGIGPGPPKQDEPPQVWVKVDITDPEVDLAPPEPSRDPEQGILTIRWKVTDYNLDSRSIDLSYSESPDGPWSIIQERVTNTGQFQWKMPGDVPYKFFVRLEARDKAGNIGTDVTDQPVIVDPTSPTLSILGVQPYTGADRPEPYD